MASLEWFIPLGHPRMHPLQWQLKSSWFPAVDDLAMQIPLTLECEVRSLVDGRREVIIWSSPLGASSFSSAVLQCLCFGMRRSPSQSHSGQCLLSEGVEPLHQRPGDEGSRPGRFWIRSWTSRLFWLATTPQWSPTWRSTRAQARHQRWCAIWCARLCCGPRPTQ